MAESNNGNWHTAQRWARFLSGHCDIALLPKWPAPDGPPGHSTHPPMAMVALHARRSADSIQAWAQAFPCKPLIVVLTGTDLYRDIRTDAAAQQSLALASHLVVLQDDGVAVLPAQWRAKTRVIYQSAPALTPETRPRRMFRVLNVGHLRDEKDPLTFMRAAARNTGHTIGWEQVGRALQPPLAAAARATEATSPAYRWLGELPRAATRQRMKRAHLLVNSSLMEGGAQVILEAIQCGTPVLATHVGGNVGMLGPDYTGYFPVGDDAGLAALVQRCATEPAFLSLLQRQCQQRAHLFAPALEKQLVINLLQSAIAASP